MKKENILVNALYWLCNISFYLLIILLVIGLGFEAFTKDGKVGKFSTGIHHSIGYELPVKFQINPKNPMFNNSLFELESEKINSLGQKSQSGRSHYVKPITKEDRINYKSIISIDNNAMVDTYELNSRTFRGNGYVIVKPKTTLNKIIISIRSYISFILGIIIFFFLKTIFKMLKSKFEFSSKLYKKIQKLGIILIIEVILTTISNFILAKDLPIIKVGPIDSSLRYVSIYMNPRLDFNFTLVLIGLSLIILATLLREGNRIQQENELTI
ncbi:DUF2975 domain-containing protein [Ichthyenterobacterium sp. W332]|uniref:DUF2975 domain-containing protein n=1 Tax=Microcosmobacter mediterraneus TaxID=3075607 RepID=A0ABU2YKZ8_9FLAO|nr:DUF2975 domain-containing protein [Ichthyenterobacterium sp. W332]MDT0557920.1 DUF2975 domain-containing protein [Ichthyenterobacterium sp. W332]